MPFASRRQQRWAHATRQPFAKRWDKQTNFESLPEKKDSGTSGMAIPPTGNNALFNQPGVGRVSNRRKNKKIKDCDCGCMQVEKAVSSDTPVGAPAKKPTAPAGPAAAPAAGAGQPGELLSPGVRRIRGNLCNVHGRYGPCDGAKAKPKKPKGGGGGKGAGAKPKKPPKTDEQRAAERQQHADERAAELTKQQSENMVKVGDETDLGDHLANLNQFAQGKPLRPEDIDFLAKEGLLEIGADGTPRKSEQANVLLNAAKRGDVQGAKDAASRARDQVAKRGEQETARTAAAAKKLAAQAEREAAKKKRDEERAAKKPGKGGSSGPAETAQGAPGKLAQRRAGRAGASGGGGGGGGGAGSTSISPGKKPEAPAKVEPEKPKIAPALVEAATAMSEGGELTMDQLRTLIRNGLARIDRDGMPVLTAAGLNATKKAQTDSERAAFANMGGGGGAGSGGSSGGGSELWPKGPSGKRTPQAAAAATRGSGGISTPKKPPTPKNNDKLMTGADRAQSTPSATDQAAIRQGARPIAQRITNAENSFLSTVRDKGFSEAESHKILDYYRKNKILKIDSTMGQYSLAHGDFLDADVMRRVFDQPEPKKKKESQSYLMRRKEQTAQQRAMFANMGGGGKGGGGGGGAASRTSAGKGGGGGQQATLWNKNAEGKRVPQAGFAGTKHTPGESERKATPAAGAGPASGQTVGETTKAYGNDPNQSYTMRHELVDMGSIQASNTANGGINPKYDASLQPRDRSRASSQAQIADVAQNMNPEVMTTDFHRIDAGTPIIDAHGNVLSGNGRTLALQRAAELHPDKYAAYKDAIKAEAKAAGIDPAAVDKMQNPVLVRRLQGDHDAAAFAREANSSGTLRMSPLEQAKVDAGQISNQHMLKLHVSESGDIDRALRDKQNKPFIDDFLATVPDNERANLLTRHGELNQMGLYRAKAAIYTKAFPGAAGERMAESMLESLDPDIKTVQNGISGGLPDFSRATALTRSGMRDPHLDISEDFAKTVDVYARIKDNPSLTANTPAHQVVAKYLGQSSMFDRELNADQERLLVHLDTIARKPTEVRSLLQRYARIVEGQPQPGQSSLFGDSGRLTRAELYDQLLGGTKMPEVDTQAGMF